MTSHIRRLPKRLDAMYHGGRGDPSRLGVKHCICDTIKKQYSLYRAITWQENDTTMSRFQYYWQFLCDRASLGTWYVNPVGNQLQLHHYIINRVQASHIELHQLASSKDGTICARHSVGLKKPQYLRCNEKVIYIGIFPQIAQCPVIRKTESGYSTIRRLPGAAEFCWETWKDIVYSQIYRRKKIMSSAKGYSNPEIFVSVTGR